MVPSGFGSLQTPVDSPLLLTSTTPMARARKTKAGSYALTERQAEVLEVIRWFVRVGSLPPTRSELAKRLGLTHQSSVDNHLHALAKKGWVELKHGVERGIQLLREGVPMYEPEDFLRSSARTGAFDEEKHEPVWVNYDLLWSMFGAMPNICLRVRGNAMNKAGLTEGGIVALKLVSDAKNDETPREGENEETLRDGEVVAARVRDEVVLRRYHRIDERTVELRPDSTSHEHQAIRIDTKDDDAEIIGVMIGRMVAGRR